MEALFAGLGSRVAVSTVTRAMAALTSGSIMTIIDDAEALATKLPSSQTTVPFVSEHVPCDDTAEMRRAPAGRWERMTTPEALAGP